MWKVMNQKKHIRHPEEVISKKIHVMKPAQIKQLIRKKYRIGATAHITDRQNISTQDVTTSRPEREESDWKLIPEEDDCDDEGVTITLEEGDNEHKTMRSVKSSSNQWEDSYYERKNDGSKEYRQIKMQKISSSRLLSKQSGTR